MIKDSIQFASQFAYDLETRGAPGVKAIVTWLLEHILETSCMMWLLRNGKLSIMTRITLADNSNKIWLDSEPIMSRYNRNATREKMYKKDTIASFLFLFFFFCIG